MYGAASHRRGTTLIDVVVGVALLVTVFLSIFGAFQLAIQVVISTKAKTGALALGNERLEFIRSMNYDDVGTAGGIPSGELLQEEQITLNNVPYTRRTFIQFVDSPGDGVGGADENGLTADYKIVKVEMVWDIRGNERRLPLVTNIVPRGIETVEGGGTLTINVIDALAGPVSGANVHIVNSSTNPAIDINTSSNVSGTATFPGAPAAPDYEISVSQVGYSSAQTYSSGVSNPNPNPAHLTVVESLTTASTFAIDQVAEKIVRTWEPVELESFQDLFDSAIFVSSSTDITIISGEARLTQSVEYAPSGTLLSSTVQPTFVASWEEFSWVDTVPVDTSIAYQLYYDQLGVPTLVPDSALPGNSVGFTTSPVDVSGLTTITYPDLRLHGTLATSNSLVTPSIQSWKLSYQNGPEPIPNVSFTMRGDKTIGIDGGGAPIYKYSSNLSTDGTGEVTVSDLEWDAYTITVDGVATGFDISEACPSQPLDILPGINVATDITLVPHTAHSLLVSVDDDQGANVANASLELTRTGFSNSLTSSTCGQAFFGGLASTLSTEEYSLQVTAAGYQPQTIDSIDVSGQTNVSVTLNP